MILDNTQIETAGVNAVEEYFNFSSTLHPSLPKEDKNPVWDGKLLLYQPGGKNKNSSLIGPILTQVKTHCCEDSHGENIKFSVRVNDLRVYRDNCGVAYFVVYLNTMSRQKTIYYRLLAPIELRQFIEDAGEQESFSVTFDRLPDLSDAIEHEFLDFYNDCQKQQSFGKQKTIRIEDIKGDIESYKFDITCTNKNRYEAYKEMTSRSVFLYAILKGDKTQTLHPIGNSRCKLILFIKDTILPVSVNGRQFYQTSSIQLINGKEFLVLGEGSIKIPLFLNENDPKESHDISITPHFKTLNQEITGLEFILAVSENNGFNLGNYSMAMKTTSKDFISSAKERLVSSKRFKQVLELLHVHEDFVIENLSDEDVKHINVLCQHYLDNVSIAPDGKKENKQVRLQISNLTFLFLCQYDENTDKYEMFSAHDLSSFAFMAETISDNQIVQIPYFMAFDKESYDKANNIDYSNFLQACHDLGKCNKKQIECINFHMLDMLNVYDKQENKNARLLQACYDVCKWLTEVNEFDDYQLTHTLNLLQIIKRQRKLSKDEEEQLYNILDSTDDIQIKFATNVLLDNKSAANRYFNKFDNNTRDWYSKMPIYHFMK